VFATQGTQVVNFGRVDELFNNPFLLPSGVGLVLLAIMIAFLATGGPGGTLSFQNPGGPDVVVRLSRARVLNRINDGKLKQFGLKSIKVGKAPKMDVISDGKIVKTSGVKIEMCDASGHVFDISTLYPGTQGMYPQFSLTYNKGKL